MKEDPKKIIISLIFVLVLIVIAVSLTAFLPFGWSKEGIPPILPKAESK